MNRIDNVFAQSKKKGKALFISYIMAGDPTLEITEKIVPELEKTGVDIIELGIPFSDPIADGTVNQEAATRALKAGANLHKIIACVKKIRKKTNIPIVFFSYLNPLLQYGLNSFSEAAAKAGVDGILVLDMPPEEATTLAPHFEKAGLKTIYLMTPTTGPARIKKIAALASGFIYYVSRLGVTGIQKELSQGLEKRLKEIKKRTDLPVAVGFGISKPRHVHELKKYCDAIVVGSAIVSQFAQNKNKKNLIPKITTFVSSLTREL